MRVMRDEPQSIMREPMSEGGAAHVGDLRELADTGAAFAEADIEARQCDARAGGPGAGGPLAGGDGTDEELEGGVVRGGGGVGGGSEGGEGGSSVEGKGRTGGADGGRRGGWRVGVACQKRHAVGCVRSLIREVIRDTSGVGRRGVDGGVG